MTEMTYIHRILTAFWAPTQSNPLGALRVVNDPKRLSVDYSNSDAQAKFTCHWVNM